ncbi:DUF1440 domain-containing protein [Apibacter muscae]|uniref:DUF1440 domain-containing protein n=1 Tax=Apibacter muscae TaxID=2509004 RepID=UPI0011ABF793|nr:DUF1440 domain-containing protein [Apibacter muscae]TWP24333.1 DUF1440 domain-containing protein [Apibacter muscae]TWP30105.1 DUF1440 domain-containing protein [Apibacter muscae]
MNCCTKNLIKGVAVGILASWVKSIVEPPLQDLGEKHFPPTPKELQLKGADVKHQPENMPPAILAKKIYSAVTNEELQNQEAVKSMKFIHYALGAVIGVAYVTLVNSNKRLKVEEGITAGAVVWAATHGSTVPALGLQGKVKDMPKSWWVWEFGSHLVFGVALEQSRKLLNKLF